MSLRIKFIFYFSLLVTLSFAQTDESAAADTASATAIQSPVSSSSSGSAASTTGFVFKPTIGLGCGLFSFYGDIYDKKFQPPMTSRIAYELNVSQYFTDYLQFNFYVLFGKLGANERNTVNGRNLNFESQIRVGGVNLLYNFDNFLPKTRTVSPYVSLGIEGFEFLSKTDIFDKHGYRYYYWTDGSIRNIDQNAPNASSAIEIQRDYTYESDIRTMNLDGFGKYPERSWAVPIGVGSLIKINEYWTFKIGATMHFTFTDYIDGVSNKSVGNRIGNSKNDNFMMTSFSLHYNLGSKKKDKEAEESNFDDVDFFALDLEDMDKDGIPDSKDSCQGTPPGIPVDAKGCPLDDDDDGVPNYKDDEVNSPIGAFVDEKGVQLTDSIIAYRYNLYIDSTGAYAQVEYNSHNGGMYGVGSTKEYMVSLGTFQKGLPAEVMTKFLSISDISSTNIDDSTTIYTSGKFSTLLDAEKRKQQLIAEGNTNAKVVYKKDGKFYDAPLYTSNVTNNSVATNNTNGSNTSGTGNNNSNATNNTNTNSNNNTNTNTNTNTNNTNTNTTGTNNTTGNNNSNNTTNSVTNNTTTNNTTTNNTNAGNTNSNNSVSNQGIVLRVQLGAYSRRLSKNVFKDVPDLIEIKTEDGLYKYMTGSFKTMDAAAKHKVEMLLKGYQGAFITAYKDGKRVTLQEAGATPLDRKEIENHSDSTLLNAVNKKLVVFKVQVGVFKNEPPEDKQVIYAKIKGLSKEPTATGLNRYTVGVYNSYSDAQKAKADVIKNYGLEDAFIVAFFNGEYISIQEALELLK